MGKPRPHKKKASKTREKSVLSAGGSISKRKMSEDPTKLLEQATILLHTGQADTALSLAQQALETSPANSPAQLSSLNAVAEIYVELGEVELARQHFLQAVELDPTGFKAEAEGGGAEKFLWLAQLSELGGQDSVQWFEKGLTSCRWEEDAENRCEALITEALLVQPGSPEVLQTLASIRISQLREDDARAALSRSLELWKDLPPDDPSVPDFPTRISLTRLLMEVSMLLEALEVLERLILEDDQSVEAWYLGGWCLYLLAEKGEAPKDPEEEVAGETPESKRQASLVASREWLKQSLTLYGLVEYEDDRLKEHALELVETMNKELGEEEEDSNAEDGEDGEEEWEGIDSDSDHEMADSQSSFYGVAKAQSPRGESSSLKSPAVEIEAAEDESSDNAAGIEEQVLVSQSEYETDSDGLEDEWETQSLYEDAIQMLRDEQLRDGSIPGACTLEEAIQFRKRLHEIGKAAFVEETIARDTVTAKKLCTAFGILPPSFLEGAPDEAYHPLLAIAISREFTRRQKLTEYNSIDDAVKLLQQSKNIIVLTGAGISTSLGIPDFRSKDTGLYSQLEHLGLSDPQEVFDIQIFREDPSVFYSVAKDILPTEKKYSPTHGFIRLLQDKGKLLTNYTQNIDNIEANAGVLPENIVQCHGSFAKATCVKCQYKVSGDEIYDDIKKGVVPECAQCRKQIAEEAQKPQGQKRKRNSNGAHKDRKNDGDSSDDEGYEIPTPGVMKPDITFFGEDLPDEFGRRLLHHDRDRVDLVIVIGTSLKVAPVAEVPGVLPSHVPQIYISRTVKMEYIIRFAQTHETFRQPEIQAIANLHNIDLEIISYDETSPYCVVKLPNEDAARKLIARSILAKDIFEFWGHGTTFEELHADVRRRTHQLWEQYKQVPFRFTIDSFAGKRTPTQKRDIIQSFSYVGFEGQITLKNPEQDFWVMERYYDPTHVPGIEKKSKSREQPQAQPKVAGPLDLYLGRYIADSDREVVNKYDLKKRRYISTTTMDAELSLITANMAGAAPGKIFYDPFVGTGSFLVAASHFGAITFGSDIDGRSFRGKEMEKKGDPTGVELNFQQYGLSKNFGDVYTSDLTNTPLLDRQFLDGIVCDPPYGVREGLRVLGTRDGRNIGEVIIDGVPAHYRPGYIAPKKPYGFEAMLVDILAFAARTLVTDGRLSMWMPTANDEEVELNIPMHENLEVLSVSVQPFNNWSRRLITYRRLPEGELSDISLGRSKGDATGVSADELNAFRRIYFKNPGWKQQVKKSPATESQ
ncbi:SIR2-domain-containing protein [Aspergillus karnatakaensis]|uniref:SIR2-domain-containing protein n=1 Tax=Aspergillus karnatakaensis TaxID=1810916 RepID=UPI003CCCD211